MILIGAYPRSVDTGEAPPLHVLRQVLDAVSPKSAAVHVLPFYAASGDGGFAADDWFSVDPALGTWEHVRRLAAERRVVVDGIYNHVGRRHPLVERFFADPRAVQDELVVFEGPERPAAPNSPRGWPVLRPYLIDGRPWWAWQTFSGTGFDLRLESPRVQAQIDDHLRLLGDVGVWGVRLDACAYYGKGLGAEQFHHPDARLHARRIATAARDAGLETLAQLDSDPEARSYFPRELGFDVPTVDYAYAAVLSEALLTRSIEGLAAHIWETRGLAPVLRPPRTHDGILLQSDQFDMRRVRRLADLARAHGLPVRMSNGEDYEINPSLPYLCEVASGAADVPAAIEWICAATVFVPGTPYFYLPALLCDIPEHRMPLGEDPRELNRAPVPARHWRRVRGSGRAARLYTLMDRLCMIDAAVSGRERGPVEVTALDHGVLRIRDTSTGLRFVGNLGRRVAGVPGETPSSLVVGRRVGAGGELGPMGFGVWKE